MARVDPDATVRLTLGGILACLATAVLTVRSANLGLGIAALIAVVALAVGVHRRVGMTVIWPLAVVALVQPWNGLRVLPFVAAGDIALVILVLIAITVVARARAHEPLIVTLVGMLIVTAGGTVGMAVAQDAGGTAEMAKFVLGAPVVLVLVMIIGPTYREGLLLLTAYAIGAAISTIVAATEPVDPSFGRSDGWGVHAGHLALSGIFGFFVMLGWTLRLRRPWLRTLAGIVGLMCAYGVVLSGTRSAVLGLVAGIVFVAVTARLRGFAIVAAFGIGGVVFLKFIVPFLPYRNNIERAFGTGELAGGTQMTNTLHADAFIEALNLIGAHPWTGIGFAEGQTAHNLELQVASMGGLLGIVGLIVMWTPMAFVAVRQLNDGWSREQGMRICTMGGAVAYFVFAQFQPLIWDRHLWFVVTLTMLLQVSSMKSVRSSSVQDAPTGAPDDAVLRPA